MSNEQFEQRLENVELALFAQIQKTEAAEQRLDTLEAGRAEFKAEVTAELLRMPIELNKLTGPPTMLSAALFTVLMNRDTIEEADVATVLDRTCAGMTTMRELVQALLDDYKNFQKWRREHGRGVWGDQEPG